MKLPKNTLISQEKLLKYLLVFRNRNDKSKWLAKAGYSFKNWEVLENDLREQILPISAIPTDNTQYGQMYEIKGKLVGPNGKSIAICTIWMTEKVTEITKFITMYPDKRKYSNEI